MLLLHSCRVDVKVVIFPRRKLISVNLYGAWIHSIRDADTSSSVVALTILYPKPDLSAVKLVLSAVLTLHFQFQDDLQPARQREKQPRKH
jgi:hypothetical protein